MNGRVGALDPHLEGPMSSLDRIVGFLSFIFGVLEFFELIPQ